MRKSHIILLNRRKPAAPSVEMPSMNHWVLVADAAKKNTFSDIDAAYEWMKNEGIA